MKIKLESWMKIKLESWRSWQASNGRSSNITFVKQFARVAEDDASTRAIWKFRSREKYYSRIIWQERLWGWFEAVCKKNSRRHSIPVLEAGDKRRWAWGTLKHWQVRPRLFEQNELTILGIWVREWHCSMQCHGGLKNASLASPSKML